MYRHSMCIYTIVLTTFMWSRTRISYVTKQHDPMELRSTHDPILGTLFMANTQTNQKKVSSQHLFSDWTFPKPMVFGCFWGYSIVFSTTEILLDSMAAWNWMPHVQVWTAPKKWEPKGKSRGKADGRGGRRGRHLCYAPSSFGNLIFGWPLQYFVAFHYVGMI